MWFQLNNKLFDIIGISILDFRVGGKVRLSLCEGYFNQNKQNKYEQFKFLVGSSILSMLGFVDYEILILDQSIMYIIYRKK